MATTHSASVPPELSGSSYDATTLSKEDSWIAECNLDEFKAEIADLGKKLQAQQGPADLAHLNKIILWSRSCQYVGALTMWYCVNPVSIFLLSLGCMSRWAIIGHHVCHGGFDKCSEGRYNRFKFGVGSLRRRVIDWLDWMLVEAWNVEHNQLHHYHLGEIEDPDLVEHNLAFLRVSPLPKPLKYLAVSVMACIWKWWYYAPNTYKMLTRINKRRAGDVVKPTTQQGKAQAAALESHDPATIHPLWFVPVALGGEAAPFALVNFFVNVLGPFFVQRFVLPPLLITMVLGARAGRNALVNLILAEVLTNIHSFIIIVTNHAGDDLYRFEKHCKPRSATFYLRQVISSSNFTMGTDVVDFIHGWLNYQIEHHLWPDLSMLSYQKAAPLVKDICKRHGVPYVQHNVFWRLKKLVDIMVGDASMRKYPNAFERSDDIAEPNTSIEE